MDHATQPSPDEPIVCTIQPGDEEETAMELYRGLFAGAFVTRERTATGVQWTFRDGSGIEARVRALAAIEQRCCAFLRITVSVVEGEVCYLAVGSSAAQAFLDQYFLLPETMGESVEQLRDRVAAAGSRSTIGGEVRVAVSSHPKGHHAPAPGCVSTVTPRSKVQSRRD